MATPPDLVEENSATLKGSDFERATTKARRGTEFDPFRVGALLELDPWALPTAIEFVRYADAKISVCSGRGNAAAVAGGFLSYLYAHAGPNARGPGFN